MRNWIYSCLFALSAVVGFGTERAAADKTNPVSLEESKVETLKEANARVNINVKPTPLADGSKVSMYVANQVVPPSGGKGSLPSLTQRMFLVGRGKTPKSDVVPASRKSPTEKEGLLVTDQASNPANFKLNNAAMMAISSAGSTGNQVSARVLATEITHGEGGYDIDVSFSAQVGEQPRVFMNNGNAVEDEFEGYIPPPTETEELKFYARAVGYPEIDSSDPVRVAWLTNGTNLVDLMVLKGVNPIFGEQRGLLEILAPYLLPDGTVNLPPNQSIGLFELGNGLPNSPTGRAYDMNDLVLLVTTPDTSSTAFSLRDSIGSVSSVHNGKPGQSSYRDTSTGAQYAALGRFSAEQRVQLVQLQAIVYHIAPGAGFNFTEFDVLVWSSLEAAINDRNHGDIANLTNLELSMPPEPYGVGPSNATNLQTFKITLDLAAQNIPPLEPSQEFVIALKAKTATGSQGLMRVQLSGVIDLGLPPDWWNTPSSSVQLNQGATTSGRFLYNILAVPASSSSSFLESKNVGVK